jgi:hypothetical protein
MAGKDINTWKMKRKERYEKPTAVRMNEQDLAGVSGGEGCYSPWYPTRCSTGAHAVHNCSGGSQPGDNCFMGGNKD